MGKINVLSFEVANLIAAGEVVERPSSVLKELIENSIDAGATEIVAEIKRGGVALIRVSDNGYGMEKEDLPVALKRHATSKIHGKEDLASIMTLGFRGEALAAISSVSEVTVITKTKEAETASMLTSEGGRVIDITDVGAADGTTVVVENLFYNVPARRKFLKKDSTEAMNVAALVERVALSRPDISIQLLIDGEEKFKTPGDGNLLSAISAVLGRDFAKKTLHIDGEANGIRVSGYIGTSENVRKNRNLENFFINGRYVKSLTAAAALEKAYTSYIAPECFPACVISLSMSPSSVDVNVHPAKLEVKFSDERPVFEAVYHTVRRALESAAYRPEMTLGRDSIKDAKTVGAFVPLGERPKGEQITLGTVPPPVRQPRPEAPDRSPFDTPVSAPRTSFSYSPGTKGAPSERDPLPSRLSVSSGVGHTGISEMTPKASLDLLRTYRDTPPAPTPAPAPTVASTSAPSSASAPMFGSAPRTEEIPAGGAEPATPISDLPPYRYVGEAFDCYLMVERDDELLVIDKHAAHERILFEEIKRSRERDGRVAAQSLLLPLPVSLTPEELSAATEYREELESVGFTYDLTADGVALTAIPDAIGASDAADLFVSMTAEITAGRGTPANTEAIRREKALYQIACKAAIKGGRHYERPVSDLLIAKVLSMPDIIVCPHGRPIAYRLSKRELDRRFDRIK